jgi:hypothetical protein
MGQFNNADYGARTPVLVYNGIDNGYLAVWAGEDDAVNHTEIYGRALSADGTTDGAQFRISEMGVDNAFAFLWVPTSPAVSYQWYGNSYTVVWSSTHTAPLAPAEHEIFGREVRIANGVALGEQELISDLGDFGDGRYDALRPAIASAGRELLVVFDGNDNRYELGAERSAVFGQALEAASQQTASIEAIEIRGADVDIYWSANYGRTLIEASQDAKSWSTISESLEYQVGTRTFTDVGGAGHRQRFYRARIDDR